MSQQPEFVDEALPKRALGALRPKRTWVNHLSFFVRRKPLGAAGAVIAGGYLGSRLGAQWLMPKTLIRLLSAALLVSGLKFLFT